MPHLSLSLYLSCGTRYPWERPPATGTGSRGSLTHYPPPPGRPPPLVIARSFVYTWVFCLRARAILSCLSVLFADMRLCRHSEALHTCIHVYMYTECVCVCLSVCVCVCVCVFKALRREHPGSSHLISLLKKKYTVDSPYSLARPQA
jgi:hypothetical protein